jgi:hypothetical protein
MGTKIPENWDKDRSIMSDKEYAGLYDFQQTMPKKGLSEVLNHLFGGNWWLESRERPREGDQEEQGSSSGEATAVPTAPPEAPPAAPPIPLPPSGGATAGPIASPKRAAKAGKRKSGLRGVSLRRRPM